MREILLSPKFIPLVLSGAKTSTIRAGRRDYQIGPAFIASGPTLIDVDVTSVRYTTAGELTEDDARREGYSGTLELISVLREFYPTLMENTPVTVVRFVLA
jgi:hypothetical protein